MPEEDFSTASNLAEDVGDPTGTSDEGVVGAHVLTQSEVDDLVEKVNTLEALLADASVGMKAKNDLISSLDAEIAGLKQTNRLLVAAADAAQGDLARHTATGAPSKLVDLPKLGDIPAHKSLEEIHADAPQGGS